MPLHAITIGKQCVSRKPLHLAKNGVYDIKLLKTAVKCTAVGKTFRKKKLVCSRHCPFPKTVT